MRDEMACRVGGAALFALACASSLAARSPAVDAASGGAGFDALLGFAAFMLGCAALVLLGVASRRVPRGRKRPARPGGERTPPSV